MSRRKLIPSRAMVIAALRNRSILRTERAGRLVGYCCDLCETRWRGRSERHKPHCILASTARVKP